MAAAVSTRQEASYGRRISALRQESSGWTAAGAFSGIVVFTETEREDLRELLTEAAKDIAKRERIANAITATTKVATFGAKLGLKMAKLA